MTRKTHLEKHVVITQSNYIPWKGYFDSIQKVDEVILLDDVQFTRRDWRNRNQIKTPHGLEWLSIPVLSKGKYHQKINETQVSTADWAESHWNTILMNYKKAENFHYFSAFFEKLYSQAAQETYLSSINSHFIKNICDLLQISTPIRWSHDLNPIHGKTERLVDLCLKVRATDYHTGPAAKDYIDEAQFRDAGIKVHYLDYASYPEYPQLHGPFQHRVSIVDLLFNAGTESQKYLKYSASPLHPGKMKADPAEKESP